MATKNTKRHKMEDWPTTSPSSFLWLFVLFVAIPFLPLGAGCSQLPRPALSPPTAAVTPAPRDEPGIQLVAARREEPDRSSELIAAARAAFAGVRDYTGTLTRQE